MSRSTWFSLKLLIRKQKYGQAAEVVFWIYLIMTFMTAQWVERICLPGLARIEQEFFNQPNRLVFVCGHPRSGTTNLQKSLVSRPHVVHGHMIDFLLTPLALKYLLFPVARIFNTIFFKPYVDIDIKNHGVGFDQELEEDWRMWAFCENNVRGLFNNSTGLGEDEEWARNAVKLRDH